MDFDPTEPLAPLKPPKAYPKRGSAEAKIWLAEMRAKAEAKFGAPLHPPDGTLEEVTSEYPCETLRRGAKKLPPVRNRKVNSVGDWKRRTLDVAKLDFEGDHLADKEMLKKAMMTLVVDGDVGSKVKLLQDHLARDLFKRTNCVSMAAVLDLLVRWFIQHPPSSEWMKGYIVEWWANHKRGPKAIEEGFVPSIEFMMAGGFANEEEYEKYLEERRLAAKRMKRVVMEDRDLVFSDITNADPEWIVDGKLQVPKPPKAPPKKSP